MGNARIAEAEFESALRQHHTLNDRQEVVLRLIAAGKTNPEIAEKLGMTLDGAKWNVSEILTKLGFASREDAAAYWRWRQQPAGRLSRWARGIFTLPAAKWVAGGIGAASAAGGVVLGLALAGGGDASVAAPSPPFVLEATYTVIDRSGTVGTGLTEPGETKVSTLRWWYQSNERYRWEIENEGLSFLILADGKELWGSDDGLQTYQRSPLPGDGPDDVVPYPPMSAFIGPAPAHSVEELMESLRDGEPDFSFERIATEQMLGRTVTVVQFRPMSLSSESDGVATSDGFGQLWIDESDMTILRFDAESEGQSFSAVVTRFDAGVRHKASTFRFDPPAGAREMPAEAAGAGSAGSSSAALGDGMNADGTFSMPVPAGFLRPGYLPSGFRVAGVEAERSESNSEVTGFVITFKPGDGEANSPIFAIAELVRPGGLRADEKAGEAVDLRGTEGYQTANGETLTLTWAERGHVVTITATGLPLAEVLAVAEGLILQER